MPRSWPYVTTPRTSGTPLKILISFFGALLLALLAAEQRPSLDCGPCDATAYVSLIPDTALALLALTLCAYASWLTLIQMRQARAADRLLESQSLLASFARAFDDAQTRGEFIQVATRVLADYAGYFGADSLRVEIVEPRTGVTVDEFLAPRFPPAIGPEVKAYFLKQNPAGRTTVVQANDHRPTHLIHDRWSLASPENAPNDLRVSGVPPPPPGCVYFSSTGRARSPRYIPPDEYGGSVSNTSHEALSIWCRTSNASPW